MFADAIPKVGSSFENGNKPTGGGITGIAQVYPVPKNLDAIALGVEARLISPNRLGYAPKHFCSAFSMGPSAVPSFGSK
jgi:hypothetical protein